MKKLFRFVSTTILETRVSGRFASDLCRAAAKVHPEKAVKLLVNHCSAAIKNRTSGKRTMVSVNERSEEFSVNKIIF